ncbi:MAG: hypothetical protein ACLFP8_08360 [Alphaproteobacteria bacterium]
MKPGISPADAAPPASGSITTSKAAITPAQIKKQLYEQGLPDGIRLIEPHESKMTAEKGYDPKDYIELNLLDPHDLCALTLTLQAVRNLTRATMPAQARLFHVFGENHFMSAHIMTQACFLATRPNCVFGHEMPVDALAVNAIEDYKDDLSRLSLPDLQKADPRGHLCARALITRNGFSAPLAKQHLVSTILRSSSALANIDAIRKSKFLWSYLSEDDPLLPEMAARVFPNHNIDLSCLPCASNTPENDFRGIILRNYIMAHRAFDAAENHKASDMVIGTGKTHLGDRTEKISYDHGLPAVLLQEARQRGDKDAHVISVYPNWGYPPERLIPPGRDPAHIPLIVHGLSEERHSQMEDYPDNYIDPFAESFHRAGLSDHPALRHALAPSEVDPVEQIIQELEELIP